MVGEHTQEFVGTVDKIAKMSSLKSYVVDLDHQFLGGSPTSPLSSSFAW